MARNTPIFSSIWLHVDQRKRAHDVFSAFVSAVTSPAFIRYLILFVMLDAIFILLHVLQVFFDFHLNSISPWITSDSLRIDKDRSLSEYYEYIKTLLCIAGLYLCFFRRRRVIYVSLMATYTVAFLDNALRLHERIGSIFPIRQGRSEFIAFVAAGLLISILLWQTRPRESPQDTAYAAGCIFFLGVLAFFVVGVDALHQVVWRFATGLDPVLAALEDGGELIALSCNLAFVWSITTSEPWRNVGDDGVEEGGVSRRVTSLPERFEKGDTP